MNILFLNIDDLPKKILKNAFAGTSFSSLNYFETDSVVASDNIIRENEIELIIKGNKPSTNYILENSNIVIPVISLCDEINNHREENYLDESYIDYLHQDEITSFTLENCIASVIEKVKFYSKLEEEKKMINDLKFREENYRSLFENSSVGMYEIDVDGNFVLANNNMLNILGLNNIQQLQKYNAFQSGISTNGARQKLKKLLDKHIEVNNFEDEWLKSDKTIIQIKENIKAIKNANGEVIFFLGVVEDISERKSIELELIKSQNNELKSEKLKSDFLAQISHEIRTPLNSLLSFVSLIKEELNFAESDNIKEYLKHIDKAANRTIRTIDLLVKTSELHTDNYEPNLKDNNLFNLLESIVNDYIDLADEKGINLQFIKAIDEEIVRFDWHTMYDVFMNLIDNAIKYTSSGSVKVYISKSFLNKFTVTVLDTGIGISKEYMNNIFKPFTQETSGYTRKYDGNGLGLALVKEYCSLNNADIFVSSEKGSGSNFTVVFK